MEIEDKITKLGGQHLSGLSTHVSYLIAASVGSDKYQLIYLLCLNQL